MQLFARNPMQIVEPGHFEPSKHWYPKALNAQIHPLVSYFMHMRADRIVQRYCHLHPRVHATKLRELIDYRPRYLLHAGADLFHVTDESGNRKMIVIETNSCPSGHKSMPLIYETQEQGGYRQYIEQTFMPQVRKRRGRQDGGLAVLYDKNPMEASGYAAALADAAEEPVFYVPFFMQDEDPPARFSDGLLEVRTDDGVWHPIRAAFRYVTQRPWARIPVSTRTLVLNPIIACLAGGRNKMMAAKAYDLFNAELADWGLHIHTPETIWDVHKNEIPLWVRKLGGQAVVKVPYGNAGQGVYTIVNQEELDQFMALEHSYDMFIVQSLIGNYNWSSSGRSGRFYHVGTMPNVKNLSYVADLRMMLISSDEGIRPAALYARQARLPLADALVESGASWDMLGTNLSVRLPDGTFSSDSSRLLMMDQRDFNKLGIGIDELIECYIQTLLAMIAIDRMANTLINQKGGLKTRLFRSLNEDPTLIDEIKQE
ncbi:MAG: hypothetical protein OHK0039_11090 [Bacteroidia bacterium]